MKIAHRYDEQGYYIEDIIINFVINEAGIEEYILPDSCTWIDLPQPNYKPKWDGTTWQETGEAPVEQEPEPTETDKLRQTIADLTQQLILNGVI